MKKQKRFMGYCAACARHLRRGQYYMCTHGCGARLCREHTRCINKHNPQCPNRATQFTDSPERTS